MHALQDDFGEGAELKASARTQAGAHGHTLGPFHVRASDPTMTQAYCRTCGLIVVVNLSLDGRRPAVYGWALHRQCQG